MKQLFFALLVVAYFLLPSCQHPDIITPTEPDPIDTSHMISCEDTIEINLPGSMEHGFFKAVKTCWDWKASGYAQWPGPPSNHLNVSGNTYFPYILTNGDTVLLFAEALYFIVPKKLGTFPLVSPPGLHSDKATFGFSYINVDVSIADWLVDTSFLDNEIKITELNLANKRVKGIFNVHLKIDTTMTGFEHYPSKLFFHEGEFDLEIVE
jgi:hypothetical protein